MLSDCKKMEEDWLNLLNKIELDPELNHKNVLEKVKEVLKADRVLYEDWQKNYFHVDHLLKVSRQINANVAGKDTFNSQSVLHLFSKFGMAKTTKSLVKFGAHVNKTNYYCSTPLILATIIGNIEIVEELLNNAGKLTINKINVHGKTALLHAMESGFVEIANVLIDNGADIDIKSGNDTTVLHYAAMHDVDAVKRLIELKADVNAKNALRETPLHYSIKSGNIDVLKYLIEVKGGDGSIDVNPMGGSLVRYAAESGQLAALKYLVEDANFDYETPDELGKSAIHYAAAAPKSGLDIVKYLIENKGVNHNILANDIWTPMFCASMCNNLEVMKYLLEEKHVDINFQDKEQGYTALYLVCYENHCNIETVKYLVDKGAAFNIRTKKMRTSVQGAAYNGKLDVITYLVEEMGADIHIIDIYGHSELSTAVEQGQFEAAKYFIEKHNMDVNIKDIDQRTMLHIAVHSGKFELVEYLINEKGAKRYLNYKRDDNLWTPLHESTTKGYEDITELLLKEGAAVNTLCMYGILPIHQAVKRRYYKIVELLLNYGSDLDPKEENGLTPLHKAAMEGDSRMVQLLVERGANVGIRNNGHSTARDVAVHHTHKYQRVADYLNRQGERENSLSQMPLQDSGDFLSSIDFKSFAGRRRQI